MSSSPAARYLIAHPEAAPAPLVSRFQGIADRLREVNSRRVGAAQVATDVFNADIFGMPQNEESVDVCRNAPSRVIESTNDYRGLLDPEGNFTGWHISTNGGASLAKEGLLPPVSIGGAVERPSGGDPVSKFSKSSCHVYAASLAYDPNEPFGNTNGIAVYKSSFPRLVSPDCGDDGPSDRDCWPHRRYAAFTNDPTHFFDKEWFDVGESGAAGEVVWVTYSDFDLTPTPPNPAGFTAEIFAVRCTATLGSCTAPIPISGNDVDVQFSDVTVGPDGRVYVTWSQIFGELEGEPQTFVHKLRVAQPGSTTFGPERVIARERLPIPFGGFLHANDFRVATYPKHEVMLVGGDPRIYVVWDGCRFRPLDTVCEESRVILRMSDDLGETWTTWQVITAGGDNYFPAIGGDPSSGRLGVAWFTNRFDPQFHNRQDVEMVTLSPSGNVVRRQRLTATSNETEADPLLGGFFIGDYIEVAALDGDAWVGYNANARHVQLLFEGIPIPQQDNYLARAQL